jgi:hypothetical protein
LHLCRSLGIKARCAPRPEKYPGAKPAWVVTFITAMPVFRLPRKLQRLPPRTKPSTTRRYIVAVEPVPSRPVRCITVDSPSHLYLCGGALVPTHNSARSPSQNVTREQLISADVLGMAGPGKSISAVMPCTVIAQDDMIDRILDRKKHPLWRGERTRLMRSMPADLDAWEKYFDLYRDCAQREPPDFAEANAYYVGHREALDRGAEPSWEARKLDWEISAVQHAMHLYCRDPVMFAAEYQNDPLPLEEVDPDELTADQIAGLTNQRERGLVPGTATYLTAFVDVQQDALYYAVCAWEADFTGYLIDYGTYPDQNRSYFTLRDLRRKLGEATGQAGTEAAIYAGLTTLTGQLLSREWPADGKAGMRIGKLLIDANWGAMTDLVHRFCRQSPFGATILPSHGKGITAAGLPIHDWQRRDGELRQKPGPTTWIISPTQHGTRRVLWDVNYWKSFFNSRLAVGVSKGGLVGVRGSFSLFGTKPEQHRMLADHLTAEFRVRTEGRGRKVDEWKARPDKRDNHLLDACVGNCVAASVLGAALGNVGDQGPPPKKPRMRLSEMQAAARARRGT